MRNFFSDAATLACEQSHVLVTHTSGEGQSDLAGRSLVKMIYSQANRDCEIVQETEVSFINQSINWNFHIKDYFEMCHFTKFDAFRVINGTFIFTFPRLN